MHSAGIGKDKWHPEEVERRPHLESRRGTTERIQRRLNPNGAAGAAEGVRTAFDQTVTCSQIKQLFISPCSPCRGPCQLVANAPEAFPGRDSTVRLDTAPQLAARQRNAILKAAAASKTARQSCTRLILISRTSSSVVALNGRQILSAHTHGQVRPLRPSVDALLGDDNIRAVEPRREVDAVRVKYSVRKRSDSQISGACVRRRRCG